jgi:hypothetical protein
MTTRASLRFCFPALAAASLAALALPACAPDADERLSSSQDPLFLEGLTWPLGEVPVCYPATTTARADFATFAPRVRNAVENSWQRVARLHFSGWGTCGSDTRATVVVNFIDTATANSGVGWNANGSVQVNLGVQRADFDAASIHEFGHVLGFGHEMRRPDFVDLVGTGCAETDGIGNTLGTDADPQSIMAATGYCQNNTQLSAWDVIGVQRAYGRKPGGSIVGLGGRCVNIEGASSASGARLVAYPCTGGSNDVWSYWSGSRQLSAAVAGVLRCAKVNGTVSSWASTPLVSAICDSLSSQKYSFTGVRWRGIGNMCVVATSASVGATLQLQPCGSRPATERWDVMNGDDRARLSGTSLCVSVPGGAATLGNPLTLEACRIPASTPEKLGFSPRTGLVRFQNLCASVMGGKPTAGSAIALWDGCASAPFLDHSLFHLSGPIKQQAQCLDLLGGRSYDGAPLGVYPCVAGAPNEEWEFYW